MIFKYYLYVLVYCYYNVCNYRPTNILSDDKSVLSVPSLPLVDTKMYTMRWGGLLMTHKLGDFTNNLFLMKIQGIDQIWKIILFIWLKDLQHYLYCCFIIRLFDFTITVYCPVNIYLRLPLNFRLAKMFNSFHSLHLMKRLSTKFYKMEKVNVCFTFNSTLLW